MSIIRQAQAAEKKRRKNKSSSTSSAIDVGPVRVDLQPALDLEEMSKLQQKCREIVPEVKRRASPVGMGLAGRFMSMNGLCPPQVVGLGDL